MITLLLAAASLLSVEGDPSGRYKIEAAPASCTLRLQPSLPSLPQAFVTRDAQSGFAFATPGFPSGLEALALWRFETDTQTLTLIEEAGEVLLTAAAQDGVWSGRAHDGGTLRLIRD
jgi:hypothetical protein